MFDEKIDNQREASVNTQYTFSNLSIPFLVLASKVTQCELHDIRNATNDSVNSSGTNLPRRTTVPLLVVKFTWRKTTLKHQTTFITVLLIPHFPESVTTKTTQLIIRESLVPAKGFIKSTFITTSTPMH
jgi:hypothetical protein